jgi:hypothetical protein
MWPFSKRKKKDSVELKSTKLPSDFKVGEVYKMSVAKGSHVKHPYYVEIIEVAKTYIVTNIPGYHSLKINYPSYEWDYQTLRMEYVGFGFLAESLLHNQENLIPE